MPHLALTPSRVAPLTPSCPAPSLGYFPHAESFRVLERKSDGGGGAARERGWGEGDISVSSYSGARPSRSWRRLAFPASVGELSPQKGEGKRGKGCGHLRWASQGIQRMLGQPQEPDFRVRRRLPSVRDLCND